MKTKTEKTRTSKTDAAERAPDAAATQPRETTAGNEAVSRDGRLPTPIELVNMAAAICGGSFPLDDDERDALFRRALRMWFEARELIWFHETLRQDATDMTRGQRSELLTQFFGMHQIGEPRISGAAAMREITGHPHQERAWKMLRKWMNSDATGLPETKPAWLSTSFGKYQVEGLKPRYLVWLKKSKSDHASEIGKKGAAVKQQKARRKK